MKNTDSRPSRLENQLGLARNGPSYLLIVMRAGQELAPADNAYIESLEKAGLLPSSGFALVDLMHNSSQ